MIRIYILEIETNMFKNLRFEISVNIFLFKIINSKCNQIRVNNRLIVKPAIDFELPLIPLINQNLDYQQKCHFVYLFI